VKDWKFGGRAAGHTTADSWISFLRTKMGLAAGAPTRGGDDEEEVSKLFFLDESSEPHHNNSSQLLEFNIGIIMYNLSLITPQHDRFLAAASKKRVD
jgi:hypothetical protein